MTDHPARDDAYCTALEQIKQMLAKYRPDVTHLQGNAVLSPRILMLLIEWLYGLERLLVGRHAQNP